jgi:hypothetical protein
VITVNTNRYRISTNFISVKIVVFIGFFSVVFNLIKNIRSDTFDETSITGLALGAIALICIFYYVITRKRIDYDDIKEILYLVDLKRQTETEIPVEHIDKILYSTIGTAQPFGSYVIIYRDYQNQKQKFRLFPIPFDNSIDIIKTDAKAKNPNLITRNWSIGLNELFD